jgi:cytochrome o ubiquinol oxidase operon protein cyoD
LFQPTHKQQAHGSLRSYVIGFLLSIILTIVPLVIVMGGIFSKSTTMVIIVALAVMQFVVQLLFFMHLREGENARWNIMALLLGAIILLTIVAGSVWIMLYSHSS